MIWIISTLVAFLLIIIVYIKDLTYSLFSINRMFVKYLEMEQSSADFSQSLFHHLTEELAEIFNASASILYLHKNNIFKLQAYHYQSKSFSDISDFLKTKEIVLNESEKEDLLKKQLSYKTLLKFVNKKIQKNAFHHILFFPVIRHNQLRSLFVFLYKSHLKYYRALKFLWINDKRLISILIDITTSYKLKDQNIFNMMMDNIRDYAFITCDPVMRITTWNKGAEIMFGYSYDEAFEKQFRDLVHDEDLSDLEKAIKISEKKEETKLKLKMKDFNHTALICEILLKRIKIEDEWMGFYILIKDVSKEEVLKNNMKNKSMITRSIVENARDGIILLDKNDKIIYFNEKIKNITQATVSFYGMEIANVFQNNYGEKIKEKIEEIKENWIEFKFLDMKINEMWYNIRIFPIIEDKSYKGVVLFFIDNTLRMHTRIELEKQKEELEKNNRDLLSNLNSAKVMQMNLVPKELPDDENIRSIAVYKMSESIGGDFYYQEKLNIKNKDYYNGIISDVAGHGVSASMLSVLVKDSYSEFILGLKNKKDMDPSSFIRLLNKKIINLDILDINIESSKFVTIFATIYDPENKRLYYASAGHPKMVILRENQEPKFIGIPNSPPIGFFENFNYHSDVFDIQKGDKWLIYTDGLLDLFSRDESYFSSFQDFLHKHKNANIDEIKQIILNKIKEVDIQTQLDDITVLLTQVK